MKFGRSMTQQNFKEQCDINCVVDRYRRSGELPPDNKERRYWDVSDIPDYQTAQNIVIETNYKFNSLPVKIRERFQNDPNKLLEFIKDKNNLEEALKLGLVNKVVTDNDLNDNVTRNINKSSKKSDTKIKSSEKDDKTNQYSD